MTDKVTISLFSVQDKNDPQDFGKQVFGEKERIKKMAENLRKAAEAHQPPQDPPEIIISALLIPNWDIPKNGYEDSNYKLAKDKFLEALREFEKELGIKVHDFYAETKLTEDEKTYMHELKANGSNADIIKTRAIIDNQNVRHLQIDSNTIIKDYQAFYNQTFGAKFQQDSLNASFYDSTYISAHNKIVYTVPGGTIAPALEKGYKDYIENNKNNERYKMKGSNSIYSKMFAPSLSKYGANLTLYNVDVFANRNFYPVNIDAPEYRITTNIVTALNQTWRDPSSLTTAEKKQKIIADEFKKIPSITIDDPSSPNKQLDAQYDFQSIENMIKKYTGSLPLSPIGDNTEASHTDYEKLLNLSDHHADMWAFAIFYHRAIDYLSKKDFTQDKDLSANNLTNDDLMKSFAKLIPDTPKGNLLTQELFKCSVQELHKTPLQKPSLVTELKLDELKSNLLIEDKKELPFKPKPIVIALKVLENITGKSSDALQQALEEDKLDNDEVNIKDFFEAIAEGDKTKLTEAYEEVNKISNTDLREKVMETAQRILSAGVDTGVDNEKHFNYIPNRKLSLQVLTELQQKQLQHKDESEKSLPKVDKKETTPLATLASTLEKFKDKQDEKPKEQSPSVEKPRPILTSMELHKHTKHNKTEFGMKVDITAEDMAKSAFGQGSNTAKSKPKL